MEKEVLENNLNRVHEWIRAADEKISIWLAFQGVVFTLGLVYIGQVGVWISKAQCSPFWVVLFVASVVAIIFSIYKSVAAVIPRLSTKHKEKSLLYFGDIASLSLDTFKEHLHKYSDADFKNDLVKQVHISSLIATKKHRLFRESIISFLIGAAGLLLVAAFCLLTNLYDA